MTHLETYVSPARANSISVVTEPAEWPLREATKIKQEPASKVTDEAIILKIEHLNDQQLDDIGICRKWRASSWRSSVRGVSPTEVCEFDYFWLEN